MISVPYYHTGRQGRGGLRGQEVFTWLHRLDLTHHFDKFLAARVEELGVVRQLGEDELVAIGISDVHERLSVLHAIRLLQTPKRTVQQPLKGIVKHRGDTGGGGVVGDIELSVLKCRDGYLYNNNGYHHHNSLGDDEGDYSECAEFDLSGSGGGGCSCGSEGDDQEHFYESVKGVPATARRCDAAEGIERNNKTTRRTTATLHPTLLRSLIKEKVIQDRIDLSRVEDDSVLRGIAAKYAADLAMSLGVSNGGGASFSSSSSSSSSGYMSLGPDLHPQVFNTLRHLRAHPSLWNVRRGDPTPERTGSSYIPGVYQPSSCLRNRDEIYDYVPPKNSIPRSAEDDFYCRPRAESLNLSVQYGTPKRSDPTRATYGFARSTQVEGRTSLSTSAFTISGSCSSATTSPSSWTSNNDAYGFVPSSRVIGNESTTSRGIVTREGVGETLIRIGRRLGLSKLLRSLRLENLESPSPHPSGLRRFQSVPPSLPPFTHGAPVTLPFPSLSSQSETSSCSVDRLPSNERIIETINRLKFKELQKRKERIQHEHRAMLLEPSVCNEDSRRFGEKGKNFGGVSAEVRREEVPVTPSASGTPELGIVRHQRQRESAASTASSHESFSSTNFPRHPKSFPNASSPSKTTDSTHGQSGQEKSIPPKEQEQKWEDDKSLGLLEFLKRHNLQEYAEVLEKEGFETLELLMEVEEEDLLRLPIAEPADRSRLLAAAHSLRPFPKRLPCQTEYQWDYYATSKGQGKGVVAVEVHARRDSGGVGAKDNK